MKQRAIVLTSTLIVLIALAFAAWWPAATLAQDAPSPVPETTTPAATAPLPSESASSETTPTEAALAKADAGPEVKPEHKLDRADNAWMLVSSALVLCMTTPGLAMFYGGLVRKKNVLSVIMQCMFLMGLMTVIWGLVGYSLCFGGTDAWLGNADYLFMRGVQATWESGGSVTPLHPTLNIPMLTHMIFQGMFFIITPALICGAFAERMKFSAMVAFSILWGLIVYCPLCHWVWGGGVLAYGSEHAKQFCAGGALDFAGGTVVHISSGVSALVCALILGRRVGFGTEPMPPHNLTYTALGAGLLWVGWFGFNAGSALAADSIAASAFAATHFSAAAGTVAWAVVEWLRSGKPTVLGASSGAVAGLVCITPAAGYVTPMSAFFMGAAAGTLCYYTCSVMKQKLGYDDTLDAFGVHGVGGTLGAILTGIFATRAVFDVSTKGELLGLLEGGNVLTAQVIATAVSWAMAAIVTLILLKVLDRVIGLRVDTDHEVEGLDISLHGEEGYIFI
jgi:Amt family ammonium transporter